MRAAFQSHASDHRSISGKVDAERFTAAGMHHDWRFNLIEKRHDGHRCYSAGAATQRLCFHTLSIRPYGYTRCIHGLDKVDVRSQGLKQGMLTEDTAMMYNVLLHDVVGMKDRVLCAGAEQR